MQILARRYILAPAVLAVGLLGATATDGATVSYSYQGNPFNLALPPFTGEMAVTGSFTVTLPDDFASLPLADREPDVTAFSFSDGVRDITQNDLLLGTPVFEFATGADGNITEWTVSLVIGFLNSLGTSSDPTAFRPTEGEFDLTLLGTSIASNNVAPGTWTIDAVPLPGAAWLFSFGLLGLLGAARRRRPASGNTAPDSP